MVFTCASCVALPVHAVQDMPWELLCARLLQLLLAHGPSQLQLSTLAATPLQRWHDARKVVLVP
jgi:hypothetical protein